MLHNWRAFQNVFLPADSSGGPAEGGSIPPAYLVTRGEGKVVAGYAEGEDFRDLQDLGPRECVEFSRDEVEDWLLKSCDLPHFQVQMDFLKYQALQGISARGRGSLKSVLRDLSKGHFLLDAMTSWWTRLLPNSYGIFLQVDRPNGLGQNLFLTFQQSRLETFIEPDLAGMSKDISATLEDRAKYLSESHSLPVYAFRVEGELWDQWAHAKDPWLEVSRAVREGRAELAPRKITTQALLALRAYAGI